MKMDTNLKIIKLFLYSNSSFIEYVGIMLIEVFLVFNNFIR